VLTIYNFKGLFVLCRLFWAFSGGCNTVDLRRPATSEISNVTAEN